MFSRTNRNSRISQIRGWSIFTSFYKFGDSLSVQTGMFSWGSFLLEMQPAGKHQDLASMCITYQQPSSGIDISIMRKNSLAPGNPLSMHAPISLPVRAPPPSKLLLFAFICYYDLLIFHPHILLRFHKI